MDTLELINCARQAGLSLQIDGKNLRVRGPQSAADLVGQLAARKAEVIEAMTSGCIEPDWASDARQVIDRLPDDSLRVLLIDFFEETAATLEFEQGLSRQAAEQNAFGLLVFQMLRRGIDVEVNHAAREA